MKITFPLSGLALVALGVSVVLAQPRNGNAETAERSFRVSCTFSHQRRVDPIVSPGMLSMHMHDFFGNRSTNANSTYRSMVSASTTCGLSKDTAAYWSPSLRTAGGTLVKPIRMQIYYSNRPHRYGRTRPFPANFQLIAGGPRSGGVPKAYWNCLSHDDRVKLNYLPNCGSAGLRMNITWPNCWDGVHRDSANHRSHVVYPVNDRCPAGHAVKIPQLRTRVWFPVIPRSSQARLVDGKVIPHMDFWNTWNQDVLSRLVRNCLLAGIGCGLQKD
jgi:hypothetical protein